MNESLAEGLKVTAEVQGLAEASLREHNNRRLWLAASLILIVLAVLVLLLYIRTLPIPSSPEGQPQG